jgi:hypothetical protein
MASYTADVKRLLKNGGAYFVRQGKGDHEIWFSPRTRITFPVDNHIVSRHTANEVLKQVGLPKAF